jgi:hypothetical protein
LAGLSSNQVFALSTAGFAGLYNAEIAAEIGNLKTSQIVGVSIAAGAAQAAVRLPRSRAQTGAFTSRQIVALGTSVAGFTLAEEVALSATQPLVR